MAYLLSISQTAEKVRNGASIGNSNQASESMHSFHSYKIPENIMGTWCAPCWEMQRLQNHEFIRTLRGISFIARVSAITVHIKQRKFQMGKEARKFRFCTGLTTIDKGGQMKDVLNILGTIEEPRISADFNLYEHLLKKYVNRRNSVKGKSLHGHIIKAGCESDVSIGNGIINMYTAFESLEDACKVFDKMPQRDEVSWTILIVGHTRRGLDREALDVFSKMQRNGFRPTAFTFSSILRACANAGSLENGKQVHAHVTIAGLVSDLFIGTALVHMYAKRGSVDDTRRVFEGMPERNVVSWNAMLGGYIQQGQDSEVLGMCKQMHCAGVKLDHITLSAVLGVCSSLNYASERSKCLHGYIIKTGFEVDVFVSTALVRMYTKCGTLEHALKVLGQNPEPDVATWTALVSGYVHHNNDNEVPQLIQQMQQAGLKLNNTILASVLSSFSNPNGLENGSQVHAYTIKAGHESDVTVGNSLVVMYARCGSIVSANLVFNGMREPDIISWTAIIAGNTQNGSGDEAIERFCQMQGLGMNMDQFVVVSVLHACATLGVVEPGKQIQAFIIKSGLESEVFVGNTLIDFYAKCSDIDAARKVFDTMLVYDLVSWNAMIVGYAQNGQSKNTVELFSQKHQAGMKDDEVTFASMLSACANLSAMGDGCQVHAHIIKTGFESDVVVGNALINMYAKCKNIEDASTMFVSMPKREASSWTSMIAGYVQNGNSEQALKSFCEMQQMDMKPDQFTFASCFRACASLGALNKGKQIHADIIRTGFELDVFAGSALVDMYAKCRSIEDASKVFADMPKRDNVSWNAMITGYSQNGDSEKASRLFHFMQFADLKLDHCTFTGVLRACSSSATLQQGKHIHACIIQAGYDSDVSVGNALVDMYAKCGSIEDASKVFEKMFTRDLVSWNAMVTGYAQHGNGMEALELFEQMQRKDMKPDHITFVGILSACSHVGLVDEGRCYFNSMTQDHGVTPTVKHYACIVDTLGRVGLLDEAMDFITCMPFKPGTLVWRTLLGACKLHGNLELGKHAADCILELETQDSAAYVLLSKIYAVVGRWDDVAKMWKIMNDNGVKKQPACSWIEVRNRVQVFAVEYR